MRLEYLQIDAFTDTPLLGNPCAVVLDADALDAARMLAVAREMNLSETAFVLRPVNGDARARYFTPAEELAFAGHPTIATVYALLLAGRLRWPEGRGRVVLELPVGPIGVDVETVGGVIERLTIEQPAPVFGRIYDPGRVLPAFGLTIADLLEGAPIQTVSTGTPQLMIPLRSHAALARARMDVDAYVTLKRDGDFSSPHLFCCGGFTPAGATAARHLGNPPDLMEDPFTGSATGGMAAFLWRYGLIDAPRFVAEQGHLMQRPGTAWVEVVGPPAEIRAVRVGGKAVEVAWGELILA